MATNKRKDFTQTALAVVQQATGEVIPPTPTKRQENGRKGGIVGGIARAARLTSDQKREIAVKAAKARWGSGSSEP